MIKSLYITLIMLNLILFGFYIYSINSSFKSYQHQLDYEEQADTLQRVASQLTAGISTQTVLYSEYGKIIDFKDIRIKELKKEIDSTSLDLGEKRRANKVKMEDLVYVQSLLNELKDAFKHLYEEHATLSGDSATLQKLSLLKQSIAEKTAAVNAEESELKDFIQKPFAIKIDQWITLDRANAEEVKIKNIRKFRIDMAISGCVPSNGADLYITVRDPKNEIIPVAKFRFSQLQHIEATGQFTNTYEAKFSGQLPGLYRIYIRNEQNNELARDSINLY